MLLRMASCLPLSLSARFVLQRGSLGRQECRSECKLWTIQGEIGVRKADLLWPVRRIRRNWRRRRIWMNRCEEGREGGCCGGGRR